MLSEMDKLKARMQADFSALDTKIIKAMIEEHIKTRSVWVDKWNQYTGKETAIDRHDYAPDGKHDLENSPNHRISGDDYALCVDFFSGLLYGNPVAFFMPDEAQNRLLQDFLSLNDFDALLSEEIASRVGAQGACGLLLYQNDETGVKVQVVPRDEYIVIMDLTDRAVELVIRYFPIYDPAQRLETHRIEIYTKESAKMYQESGSEWILLSESVNNFTGVVPFVEIFNPRGQADFDPAADYIYGKDLIASTGLNTLDSGNNPIAVALGMLLQDQDFAKLMKKRRINISENGDFRFESPEGDTPFMAEMYSIFKQGIHEAARFPDFNDDKFVASNSGESRKWKLLNSLYKAGQKWRLMEKGLRQMFRVLEAWHNRRGQAFDAESVKMVVTEKLPKDIAYDLEILTKGAPLVEKGFLSLETLLMQVSFVDNPAKEIERAEKTRSENENRIGRDTSETPA